MTLGLAGFAVLIGVPWLAGALLAFGVGLRTNADRLGFVAWSWLLGTLMLAGWLAGCCVLGWIPSAGSTSGAVVGLGAVVAVIGRRMRRSDEAALAAPPRWHRLVFGIVVAACVLSFADEALLTWPRPVIESDECHIWAAKAKALFCSGGFTERFRAAVDETLYRQFRISPTIAHADYPLFPSLLHLWTYVVAGRIVHVDNRLVFDVFGVVLLLLAASALRRICGPLLAAPILIAVATTAYATRGFVWAHADGIVAVAALAMVDAHLRASGGEMRRFDVLSALAATILVWSKHEGVLILAAFLVSSGSIRWLRRASRPRAAMSLATLVPWVAPAAALSLTWAVNGYFGMSNDLVSGNPENRAFWTRAVEMVASRGGLVARWMLNDVILDGGVSRGLFVATLLAAVAFPRRLLLGRGGVAVATTVLVLLGYSIVFVGTHQDLVWHWTTAGRRISSHVVPLAALGVAFALQLAFPSCGSIRVRSVSRETQQET